MARHKQLHQFSEQIWKGKREGASHTELQKMWNCSVSSIRYHVEKVDNLILDEYAQGVTFEELGKKYKVTAQIIQDVIEEADAKN